MHHHDRIAAARSAIDYITGQSPEDQLRPVPNCPGWTVYNAAAHIGRVAIAWQEMSTSAPDDTESRERGYQSALQRPTGSPMSDLAAWAHSAIDQLADDVDRRCYFSMTGGEGTVGLWGWHAASELAVHRLDVELALGHPASLTDDQALDAATYTCSYFLPAMRRVTGSDPGRLTVQLMGASGLVGDATIESESSAAVVLRGGAVDVLLALWGRPHGEVRIARGDREVWERWQALPGEAFQLGTFD